MTRVALDGEQSRGVVDTESSLNMARRYTAVIVKEENWYVAHCLELGVVSQHKTVEEAKTNLKEAVELYLESFDDEELPAPADEAMLYYLEVAS